MQREQAELEKRLWEERQGIEKRHEEKVRVARTKRVERVPSRAR